MSETAENINLLRHLALTGGYFLLDLVMQY